MIPFPTWKGPVRIPWSCALRQLLTLPLNKALNRQHRRFHEALYWRAGAAPARAGVGLVAAGGAPPACSSICWASALACSGVLQQAHHGFHDGVDDVGVRDHLPGEDGLAMLQRW